MYGMNHKANELACDVARTIDLCAVAGQTKERTNWAYNAALAFTRGVADLSKYHGKSQQWNSAMMRLRQLRTSGTTLLNEKTKEGSKR